MKNNFFNDWISQKLHFPLLVLLSVCVGFSSGVSSSISTYMVSSFSTSIAHASMCSYAYVAGMAVGFLLSDTLRNFLSLKEILISCILLILLFNYIILSSDSVELDVLATFVIGGLRILGILVIVFNMLPILMPNGSQRYVLYGVYYPISLLVSPISGWATVMMTDRFGWQFSFHICNLMLFTAIICVIIFVKNKPPKHLIFPFKFDWIGIFLAAGWMYTFAYFWSYGRYKDWFDSTEIRYAFGSSLILALLLLIRTNQLRHKLFTLHVFQYRNVRWGIIFIFFFCIFYANTSLITGWMNIAFHNNPIENVKINLYPTIGYIIGAVSGMIYYKRYNNFKIMLMLSLGCYIVSAMMMYFLVSTEVSEAQLLLPMILRGMGIILSYITVGLYVSVDVPMSDFVKVPPILVFVRSYLGPTIFGGIYSLLVYNTQVKMLTHLGSKIDRLDSVFMLRFGDAAKSSKAFTAFSTQAMIESIKINFGWSCIAGIALFVFILFFPIYKHVDRKIMNWNKSKNQKDVAEIAAV